MPIAPHRGHGDSSGTSARTPLAGTTSRLLDSRAFLVTSWLLVAGALAYAGASSYHRVTGPGTDFNVFYMAGRIAASDHPLTLYHEHADRGETYTYIYLPFLAIAIVPIALAPPGVAAVAWFLLNVAFTLHSAALLATGLLGPRDRRRPAFAALTLLLVVGFTVENIFLGQVHALLLWLMTCSWHLARRGRGATAAACMAIATVVKLLPGVFALYFVLRREWRNLAAFVAALALAGAVLPYAAFGPATATTLLAEFYRIQMAPYLAGERGAGGTASIYTRTAVRKTLHDQDVGALLQRHFTADHGLSYGPRDYAWLNLVAWQTPTVRRAVFAFFLLVVAATVAVVLKYRRRLADEVLALDLEFSVFTMLSLLLAPRNRVAYMTVFLLPFATLLAVWLRDTAVWRARRAARTTIVGATILASLMMSELFMALSVGFYLTLWIWAGVLVVYARAGGAEPAAPGPPTAPLRDTL